MARIQIEDCGYDGPRWNFNRHRSGIGLGKRSPFSVDSYGALLPYGENVGVRRVAGARTDYMDRVERIGSGIADNRSQVRGLGHSRILDSPRDLT